MKKSSGGLLTNVKGVASGSAPNTVPVKANMKSAGKAAPVTSVKAVQKSLPSTSRKLGNHWK